MLLVHIGTKIVNLLVDGVFPQYLFLNFTYLFLAALGLCCFSGGFLVAARAAALRCSVRGRPLLRSTGQAQSPAV